MIPIAIQKIIRIHGKKIGSLLKKNHIGQGEVIVDNENKLFILFFHGKLSSDSSHNKLLRNTVNSIGKKDDSKTGHKNYVAFSSNGLNFNDPETGGGQPGKWGPTGQAQDGGKLSYGPLEQWGTLMGEKIWRTQIIHKPYPRIEFIHGKIYAIGKKAVMSRPYDQLKPFKIPDSLLEKGKSFGQIWEQHNDDEENNVTKFFQSKDWKKHPNNTQSW